MIACVSLPLSYSRRSEKGDVKERWENIFDLDSFIQQIRRAKETFSLIVIIMFDPEVRKQSYLCLVWLFDFIQVVGNLGLGMTGLSLPGPNSESFLYISHFGMNE